MVIGLPMPGAGRQRAGMETQGPAEHPGRVVVYGMEIPSLRNS